MFYGVLDEKRYSGAQEKINEGVIGTIAGGIASAAGALLGTFAKKVVKGKDKTSTDNENQETQEESFIEDYEYLSLVSEATQFIDA